MRLPATFEELPLWPPILATRGPGAASSRHRHHAMHLVLCVTGELEISLQSDSTSCSGVLTGPDVEHAIDARGADLLLVFLDPESDAGAMLQSTCAGSVRFIGEPERAALVELADPLAIMRDRAWLSRAATILGETPAAVTRRIHPRVRKLIRLLRERPVDADNSLEGLAELVGLSPGRLMHVFTESIGIPLRGYLAWLKLQRAAAAIVGGAPLADAAQRAGFADAGHMTRTFRQMFGTTPSALRPRTAAS